MENTRFKISQYACAVLLIVSSIALVAYQVIMIDDVSSGLLVYVAQAFLFVASIFGLDYYVKLITRKINTEHGTGPRFAKGMLITQTQETTVKPLSARRSACRSR